MNPSSPTALDSPYQAVWLFGDPAQTRPALGQALRGLARGLAKDCDTPFNVTSLWRDTGCHGHAVGWWQPARPGFGDALLKWGKASRAPGCEIWLAHVEDLSNVQLTLVTPNGLRQERLALKAPEGGWAPMDTVSMTDQMLHALHSQVWEKHAASLPPLPRVPPFLQAVLDNDFSGLGLALREVTDWHPSNVASWWLAVEEVCTRNLAGFGQPEPFLVTAGSRTDAMGLLIAALPVEHRDLPRLCQAIMPGHPWLLDKALQWGSPEKVWDVAKLGADLIVPRGVSRVREAEELFFQLSPPKQRQALSDAWYTAEEQLEGEGAWPAGGVGRVDFAFVARAFSAQPDWPRWGELLGRIGGKMALPVMGQELLSTLRARELDMRLPAPARSGARGPRF